MGGRRIRLRVPVKIAVATAGASGGAPVRPLLSVRRSREDVDTPSRKHRSFEAPGTLTLLCSREAELL